MAANRVIVLESVSEVLHGDWTLCFEWCRYEYADDTRHRGYRFIWKRPNGHYQPARGQARLPSIEVAQRLMRRAVEAGWGAHIGEMDGFGVET